MVPSPFKSRRRSVCGKYDGLRLVTGLRLVGGFMFRWMFFASWHKQSFCSLLWFQLAKNRGNPGIPFEPRPIPSIMLVSYTRLKRVASLFCENQSDAHKTVCEPCPTPADDVIAVCARARDVVTHEQPRRKGMPIRHGCL